ncbi:unnamed protein product [Polarella glacialis]|uniref:Uncharacterized protein n=1 Tax=Polarella glacialis TaxID=89957 RepID=A0A813LJ24_POLGL|nr:unnamed protein product [Polarella glacialis]CAE8730544.1 unnamed protein product [Polarella glacialis]
MASFRLVGRVAFAAACLLVAVVCTEAARSLSSAEVAQVQPGRRSPGRLVVAALLAGLVAVAGHINQISASRPPPIPRRKIQWERMVSEPILATRLQPECLPRVQLHRLVTEKGGVPTLGRRGDSFPINF